MPFQLNLILLHESKDELPSNAILSYKSDDTGELYVAYASLDSSSPRDKPVFNNITVLEDLDANGKIGENDSIVFKKAIIAFLQNVNPSQFKFSKNSDALKRAQEFTHEVKKELNLD